MKVRWPPKVSGEKGLIKRREGWAGNTSGCWFRYQWWNDGGNALIFGLSRGWGWGGHGIWLDPVEMKRSGWVTCPFFNWAAFGAANQHPIIDGWIFALNPVKVDSFKYFICYEVTVLFNTCSARITFSSSFDPVEAGQAVGVQSTKPYFCRLWERSKGGIIF